MIQAPQTQYITAQQPVQMQNSQACAYNPVQYTAQQTPCFYNYPMSSSYLPTERAQYNGVNIEVINPQGQGGAPGYTMPAQFMPVQQPFVTTPQYQVSPYPVTQPAVQTPMPQTPEMQTVYEQPIQQIPAPQIYTPVSEMQMPAQPTSSQDMTQTTQNEQPVIEQPVEPDVSVSPESFAARLKTDDLEAQKATIEEIAETVKNDETAGPVLLDTQVFDALVEVIDKDTSSLAGPSPDVIELRQKPENELSEEEKQKASTPSPLEQAEINKQYALYTISYMQERLNNELEKRNGSALELKDLPHIEKVIDTVKSNPNPMLRLSAISSLAHISRPEYKEDLATIFTLAKEDENEKVRTEAENALEKIGAADTSQKLKLVGDPQQKLKAA